MNLLTRDGRQTCVGPARLDVPPRCEKALAYVYYEENRDRACSL
jgi:hypothetical protein